MPDRGERDGRGAFGPHDGREARRIRNTHGELAPEPEAAATDPAAGRAPGKEPAPPRRSSSRRLARVLLTTLLLGLIAIGSLVAWALMPVSDTSQLVEFEVLPGWGASRVSQELEDHRLVRSGRIFSAYLRLRGLDRSIGEGLYDLDRSASAPELADALVRGGRPRVATVVIPEGLRGSALAQRLEEAGLHDRDSYLELIENPDELRPPYLPGGATLEGYLFPASYEIPYSDSPAGVLNRLLGRFDQELDATVLAELERMGMTVHEWVILASMVQSEAGSDDEMPLIAGVFLNRLERGMALQSDPTVAYGLGKSLPELDPLAGDMRADHEWNTYTRSGLPAGPISNPGRSALRAVLTPVRTDADGNSYLYFLHGFDEGEIVFRPNIELEGHNRDVARYLRGE